MTLLILLNPKLWDAGGLIVEQFYDTLKKKKRHKEIEIKSKAVDEEIIKYQETLKEITKIGQDLQSKALQADLKAKLLQAQLKLQLKRIEIGQLILQLEEEEYALLLLLMD